MRSTAPARRAISSREAGSPSKKNSAGERIADWDRWTQGLAAQRKKAGTAGHWINYVKAAALYLEHIRPTLSPPTGAPLRGMNMLVSGTVPVSGGLSSSSSIVVGTAEALIHRNRLPVSAQQLVEICGLAEWYVGTRGGAGDHAAIKFGRRGQVSHLGNHPLTVDAAPFPEDFSVVLINSLIEANKSTNARDEFNNRIAAYEFGLLLLRKSFPQYAAKAERLRDVNPQTLGVREAEICRMLLRLPPRMSRGRSLRRCRSTRSACGISSARTPAGERIRRARRVHVRGRRMPAVAIGGGIAAPRRPRPVRGNHQPLSRRRPRHEARFRRPPAPVHKPLSDEPLRRNIADLESGHPERIERARLWRLPGGYDASLRTSTSSWTPPWRRRACWPRTSWARARAGPWVARSQGPRG